MLEPLEKLFILHRAKSGLLRDYSDGSIPYVGNGLSDNAVAALVKPMEGDKVFKFRGITISAFCEAAVQVPPFIACGRAGNGLVVLEPRTEMPIRQLAYIAAYINHAVRWRFNWYRQTTVERLRGLLVPTTLPENISFNVAGCLPQLKSSKPKKWKLDLHPFTLGDLYEIRPGFYHSLSEIEPGNIPIVSCGDRNNGIAGYYNAKEGIHKNRLTIAFNGDTLATKYHPYIFSAKDDVAICIPRNPLETTTELFIGMMMNRERWRYSYYRKCFAEKLRRFVVRLPAKNGVIDEGTIKSVVEGASYWQHIDDRIQSVGKASI